MVFLDAQCMLGPPKRPANIPELQQQQQQQDGGERCNIIHPLYFQSTLRPSDLLFNHRANVITYWEMIMDEAHARGCMRY